ncbi:MAG: Fic family protein [Hyphomicrobiaceae bacterium]
MANAKQTQQFDALKRAMASFSTGASLQEIEAATRTLGLSRATLIRRLNELIETGQLTKTGVSRAARYQLVVPPATPTGHDRVEGDLIPLSRVAVELLTSISRPLLQRTPVAYDRSFLDAYKANKTFYLSETDRARLREVGTPSAAVQPAGTYAQAILTRLLIDLSWNSSRLEGNTYSLLETKRLIDLGEEADGKGDKDAQMILNHKEAIEFLVSSAGETGFNRYTILNLHAMLANNLLEDPAAAGQLRREPVGISASVYHPPEVPQLIEDCFGQILTTASAITDPFEQAFFVMVHLPYLQPFIDVNKRVSRLAANIPLIKNNLSPLSFVKVPNEAYTSALLAVYELRRIELLKEVFLWAYERSAARYVAIRQTLGEPDKFRLRYRTAMRELIAGIIREPMGKKDAARHVARWATDHIEAGDRPKFIEAVETELLALHEGNFARYQVRPAEFKAWQHVWAELARRAAPTKGATRKS